MNKVRENLYSTDRESVPFELSYTVDLHVLVETIKGFEFDLSRGVKQNEELIPPPSFTDRPFPFNWGYHQNANIKIVTDINTGETQLVNQSAVVKLKTLYLPHDVPPSGIPHEPASPMPSDPILNSLVNDCLKALSTRPIWTRRALINHLGEAPGIYLLKVALQYCGYQFRSGPWRDAIIRFGVDPRTAPSYRIYQTMFFKLFDEPQRIPGQPWMDVRSEYTRKEQRRATHHTSHIFDGKTLNMDGKVWQVCDVTDPLLTRLLATEELRTDVPHPTEGWFYNGTWAKVKAIMRLKIAGIRQGRILADAEFASALRIPDHVVGTSKAISVPVPDLRISAEAAAADVDIFGEEGAAAGESGLRKRRRKGRSGGLAANMARKPTFARKGVRGGMLGAVNGRAGTYAFMDVETNDGAKDDEGGDGEDGTGNGEGDSRLSELAGALKAAGAGGRLESVADTPLEETEDEEGRTDVEGDEGDEDAEDEEDEEDDEADQEDEEIGEGDGGENEIFRANPEIDIETDDDHSVGED